MLSYAQSIFIYGKSTANYSKSTNDLVNENVIL